MNGTVRPWVCTGCANTISRKVPNRSIHIPPLRRTYTSKPRLHDGRPFRMAVIGSGPAGFYTAYKVMSKIENSRVDMFEQLPVPYGLVRFGVAPDHPEVKVGARILEKGTVAESFCRTARTNSKKSQNRPILILLVIFPLEMGKTVYL